MACAYGNSLGAPAQHCGETYGRLCLTPGCSTPYSVLAGKTGRHTPRNWVRRMSVRAPAERPVKSTNGRAMFPRVTAPGGFFGGTEHCYSCAELARFKKEVVREL